MSEGDGKVAVPSFQALAGEVLYGKNCYTDERRAEREEINKGEKPQAWEIWERPFFLFSQAAFLVASVFQHRKHVHTEQSVVQMSTK